jgi:GWxTD domain-containing protein
MKRIIIFLFLAVFGFRVNILAITKVSPELKPEFKEWVKLVSYIATSDEKKIFAKIKTDRDRRIFIALFWSQRDPSPGTKENEFKTEITGRFIYVNKHFGHGTPKPGWKTDMGEIYMMLGAPESIDKITNTNEVNPIQIWYYRGKAKFNLPDYFNIVFFKPHVLGEWQFYSPAGDGPASLLRNSSIGRDYNYTRLYNKIKRISPQLANASVSMVPGKRPYRNIPSPKSNILISRIYQSPSYMVNTSYATDFLSYKGYIKMRSSTRFIKSSFISHLIPNDNIGLNFLNFVLEPKKLSLVFNEQKGKYYFNVDIIISLNEGEKKIYTYFKNFETYINETDINQIKRKGIQISDFFPIIAGKYQMTVFVENKINGEISFLEKKLEVFPINATPRLLDPVLAGKSDEIGRSFFPYKFGENKLSVDPENVFSFNTTPQLMIGISGITEILRAGGFIRTCLTGMSQAGKTLDKQKILLKDLPSGRNLWHRYKYPASALPPDYYRLKIELCNAQNLVVHANTAQFTISPRADIPKPVEVYSKLTPRSTYFFNFLIGVQYKNSGNLKLAEGYLRKSHFQNNNHLDSIVELLNVYLLSGQYKRILTEIEQLEGRKGYRYFYLFLKGKALYALKQYTQSLDCFLHANQLNDNDFNLINLIALNFLKLNDKPKAVEAFKASLRLNNNQPMLDKIFKEYGININR